MGCKHLTIGSISLMIGAVYATGLSVMPESRSPPQPFDVAPEYIDHMPRAELDLEPAEVQEPPLVMFPVSHAARGGARTLTNKIATSKTINLAWQTEDNESEVTVDLAMVNTAVNLEDIDAVTAVDCTGQTSVMVTFADKEAFDEAVTEWGGLNDSFVMVTNHMGDCDNELERSFFVADSDTLASFESNLTIIAQTQKSDIESIASEGSIDFKSTGTVNKRAFSLKDGLTLHYDYKLPAPKPIFQTNFMRRVEVHLNEAEINNTIKFTGHAKWRAYRGVQEFYLDFHKSLHQKVNIDIKVKGRARLTYAWKPVSLTYAAISIPGIITLGPTASLTFGGMLVATTPVNVKGTFESTTPNGMTRIDLINWGKSTSTGWDPEYNSDYTVTQGGAISIGPFVAFTVQVQCQLFNTWSRKVGIKAGSAFPLVNAAQLQSHGSSNSTDMTAWNFPDAATAKDCEDGLKQSVNFTFKVIFFVNKIYRRPLYSWKTPFWRNCAKFAVEDAAGPNTGVIGDFSIDDDEMAAA